MNKSELIDEVFNQTVMPKKDCVRAVDAVFGIILAELEKGNSVKIANFGTFEIKQVPERKITDLRSGEVVSVPAQETVRFRPRGNQSESQCKVIQKVTFFLCPPKILL